MFSIVLVVVLFRLHGLRILEGLGFSKEVYASKGELLRLTLSPDEKYRMFRPLNTIQPVFREAVLLLEDKYFYYHPGVNPLSMIRAILSYNSDRKIGGSTITMQLVRLRHRLYTRSIFGKIRQIAYALSYEILYSKDAILEAYLNLAPYGGNIEGIEAASRIYFNKSSSNLNLLESLTLAVVPQNPLKRSLNLTELSLVHHGRSLLIKQWLTVHPSDSLIISAGNLPVLSSKMTDLPFYAPHFVEEAIKAYPLELSIQTTLDLQIQRKIQLKIKSYVESIKSKGINNASAVLIEAKTGEVKAWVGSADFNNSQIQGQIDGIKVNRSPGSTLKPFIYGRAIDEGIIHPGSILKDSPQSFGTFDPENFDRRFLGPISATEALTLSRNIPAVYLNSKIKSNYIFDLLKSIGVDGLKRPETYGLGIALGTVEMSPFDLASLYTALYNRGIWKPLKITKSKGLEKSMSIMTPESAFLVRDMLLKTQRTSSSVLNDQLQRQYSAAWKTGTSYGYRDAWTAGIFGPYVLVVWLGNFDFSENQHLIGREVAAPLFFQIADLFAPKVLDSDAELRSAFGLNLKQVEICSASGEIPNESCPHKKHQYFIPAVSPIHICQLHQKVAVSNRTGLRVCGSLSESSSLKVYEFWSSDLLEIFQKYGVQRNIPPQFEPTCKNKGSDLNEMVPKIVSPKMDFKYILSYAKKQNSEKIPLKAIASADVRKLNWFANSQLIGSIQPSETLFYEASAGQYEFMVVDDQGRSTSLSVVVQNGF